MRAIVCVLALVGCGADEVGVCLSTCSTSADCGRLRECVARAAEDQPLACLGADFETLDQARVAVDACVTDDECAGGLACTFGRLAKRCEVPCRSDADCLAGVCVAGRCEACRPGGDACPEGTTCRRPDARWGRCEDACERGTDCGALGLRCTFRSTHRPSATTTTLDVVQPVGDAIFGSPE